MRNEKGINLADVSQLVEVGGAQLQRVKLGPGVVGRNTSVAWVFEIVALAGVIAGIIQHSTLVILISIGVGFLGMVFVLWLNTNFARNNPVAAVTEGADFTLCEITRMGSKDKAVIEMTKPVPPPDNQPENPL